MLSRTMKRLTKPVSMWGSGVRENSSVKLAGVNRKIEM